jgi:hypothetical protein
MHEMTVDLVTYVPLVTKCRYDDLLVDGDGLWTVNIHVRTMNF